MTNKLLEIENLRVIYETDDDEVEAINGLNFTINKGETFGLVGETGAGKTSTALSILRLLPKDVGIITGGSIEFYVEDIDDSSKKEKDKRRKGKDQRGIDIVNSSEQEMRKLRGNKISMIFQDPMTSLDPIVSIGDQIYEVLEIHRDDMSKDEKSAKVDEILTKVGLPISRKGEYPHEFSGGMRQRVVIAMALACEPQLLLADEPTTALDVTIQAQILELMKELKEDFNTAMLMITHDLGVVAEICDRVAVMYSGKIIEMGTVEDIFESENHHPYTEGLFSSLPDLEKESDRLNPIKGLMPDPTNLPDGCHFHVRCKECMEICKTVEPEEIILNKETGHMIKCHLFND